MGAVQLSVPPSLITPSPACLPACAADPKPPNPLYDGAGGAAAAAAATLLRAISGPPPPPLHRTFYRWLVSSLARSVRAPSAVYSGLQNQMFSRLGEYHCESTQPLAPTMRSAAVWPLNRFRNFLLALPPSSPSSRRSRRRSWCSLARSGWA